MDRDNASTATQAKSGLTRRGVMRKTALGVGATASIGGASRLGYGPVGSANAIAPALIVGGGIAAGAAVGYLLNNVDNPFTGSADEDYTELAAESLHARIYENALSMHQADTAVLGNIDNLLSSSANYVVAESKKSAIDKLNSGATVAEADTAAQDTIGEFYATQQKNLAAHLSVQLQRILPLDDEVRNQTDLSMTDVFQFNPDTNTDVDTFYPKTYTLTLTNGNSFSYDGLEIARDGGSTVDLGSDIRAENSTTNEQLQVKPVDTGESATMIEIYRFQNSYSTIISEYESVSSEMGTWVNGVGESYLAGDIDTGDMISPSELLGDSQTEDGYSFAGAELAAMGIKTSDFALEIELMETGSTVRGSIYHNDESVDSLQKDVQYDPADISGTVYLAYQNTDDNKGDLISLDEPFIIRSITDSDGNELNAANFDSKNQQTYDQELEQIQEELEQIREIRRTLEEQRDEVGSGGAGAGFFDGGADIQTLGIVAGGAALAALLFGNN